MGTQFNFTTGPRLSPIEALKEAENMIGQAEYDSGPSGYSGTFAEATGGKNIKKTFLTEKEAEDWLEENAQKWEEILIVKITNPPSLGYGAWCSS